MVRIPASGRSSHEPSGRDSGKRCLWITARSFLSALYRQLTVCTSLCWRRSVYAYTGERRTPLRPCIVRLSPDQTTPNAANSDPRGDARKRPEMHRNTHPVRARSAAPSGRGLRPTRCRAEATGNALENSPREGPMSRWTRAWLLFMLLVHAFVSSARSCEAGAPCGLRSGDDRDHVQLPYQDPEPGRGAVGGPKAAWTRSRRIAISGTTHPAWKRWRPTGRSTTRMSALAIPVMGRVCEQHAAGAPLLTDATTSCLPRSGRPTTRHSAPSLGLDAGPPAAVRSRRSRVLGTRGRTPDLGEGRRIAPSRPAQHGPACAW